MSTAKYWIEELKLTKHPEGGHYLETYRSSLEVKPQQLNLPMKGSRSMLTSIYFLLEQDEISAFHRIKSDELWFHQEGDALNIHVIDSHGNYELKKLGKNLKEGEQMQHLVCAGDWFASELGPKGTYGLVACAVAPGFDFQDFELADSKLALQFPQHANLIDRLLVR